MDKGLIISSDFPYESRYLDVYNSRMHYVEVGSGDPILFLHGNPTSSYLWRNVIRQVEPYGRCIAPDLIGMGKSGKPDIEYTFFDHVEYLDAFIEELDLQNITLVLHDWGSGLGFHYAKRHPTNVKALVFMEAMIRKWDSIEDMPDTVQPLFRNFRTPGVGETMLIDNNVFVEQLLPGGVGRPLSEKEMAVYREPYIEKADRKPVWQWPRQVPIGNEPPDVVAAVDAYSAWLTKSTLPKLMFTVTPGIILTEDSVRWAEDHLPNLTTIELGPGIHYIQEVYPYTIGDAIADWYAEL